MIHFHEISWREARFRIEAMLSETDNDEDRAGMLRDLAGIAREGDALAGGLTPVVKFIFEAHGLVEMGAMHPTVRSLVYAVARVTGGAFPREIWILDWSRVTISSTTVVGDLDKITAPILDAYLRGKGWSWAGSYSRTKDQIEITLPGPSDAVEVRRQHVSEALYRIWSMEGDERQREIVGEILNEFAMKTFGEVDE